MNTKSELEEAPLEIEECQPLVSRAPFTNEEFEVSDPSNTRITSLHSLTSSDSTAPLSPDHLLTQTSPTPTPTQVSFHCRTARMTVHTQRTLSPRMSAQIAEAATLSPSSFRKRYQGTLELVEDTKDESSDSGTEREGSEDEGSGSEDKGPSTKEEEVVAVPEGQQQAVPVVDTASDKPLGLCYGALRHRELVVGEGEMPSTFEVGPSSKSMTKHEEAERRLVLALEAWAGQTDAQRVALWHAIYDIQIKNHDLRMHIAKERRERLELTNHVARMKRRHDSKGE
ncbi:hypothetical protein Tco_1577043 [Tanacetum coccineum]